MKTTELISQPNFLKSASCRKINKVYRFDIANQWVEMVKINKPLDEESLAICTVVFSNLASTRSLQ